MKTKSMGEVSELINTHIIKNKLSITKLTKPISMINISEVLDKLEGVKTKEQVSLSAIIERAERLM